MSRRDEILSQVEAVPSLPSVVIKLRRYLNDPDVDFNELAKVIEYDPGLTANVLRLANSSYFGWSRSISTVKKEAISRLGTSRIFQMVLCMTVAPMVSKPIKGYDIDSGALWQHSIATAICAEQLAKKAKIDDADEAFTTGLLHDVGKVVLGTFVEIDDEPIKEVMEMDGLAFNEAEQMVLKIDHSEVAGILLERWSLPPAVVEAARNHHAPGEGSENQQLIDLVHVADVLCLKIGWGAGGDGLSYRLDEVAVERLGVDMHAAEDVVLAVMEGIEEVRNMYDSSTEGEQGTVQHSHS